MDIVVAKEVVMVERKGAASAGDGGCPGSGGKGGIVDKGKVVVDLNRVQIPLRPTGFVQALLVSILLLLYN